MFIPVFLPFSLLFPYRSSSLEEEKHIGRADMIDALSKHLDSGLVEYAKTDRDKEIIKNLYFGRV